MVSIGTNRIISAEAWLPEDLPYGFHFTLPVMRLVFGVSHLLGIVFEDITERGIAR
jgi:hypothetical protein